MPYTIYGESVGGIEEPQLKDGTMWVPLRALATSLGANVDWDPDNKVAIVYHADHIVTIKIGDANVDINGSAFQLQAPPYVDAGDTWVPVRLFSDGLGMQLTVDLGSNAVILDPAA